MVSVYFRARYGGVSLFSVTVGPSNVSRRIKIIPDRAVSGQTAPLYRMSRRRFNKHYSASQSSNRPGRDAVGVPDILNCVYDAYSNLKEKQM